MFCCALLCVQYYVCNHLDGEERAGWFALFVFLVSHDCCDTLPRSAMVLSAVRDCCISDHTHLLSKLRTILTDIFAIISL